MTYMQDFDFEISEFELLSRYFVHFRSNTFGKSNPAVGKFVSLLLFFNDGFRIK